jgi:hypothetical protein
MQRAEVRGCGEPSQGLLDCKWFLDHALTATNNSVMSPASTSCTLVDFSELTIPAAWSIGPVFYLLFQLNLSKLNLSNMGMIMLLSVQLTGMTHSCLQACTAA